MTTSALPAVAASFADASGAMLAAILDQSADCIKVVSAAGAVEYMNRNGQCAMEIDDFCAVAGHDWASLWPRDAREPIERAIAAARNGQQSRFEAFCPTAKGTPRWWDVSVSPLRRPDGTIDSFIATSRDITERVNQSALRDAVADEMRHRLRNNYVVVGSLLTAYSRGKPEQRDFAADMISRLNGLGVAQTMKAQDGNSCLLGELVPALLDPYSTPDCKIQVGALDEVSLGQAQIDTLALVLGELAVNSTKHGALSSTGHIRVSGRLADGLIHLDWSERSQRPVTRKARDGGQGLTLMRRVLAARSGDIAIAWAADGLDASFHLAAS